MTRDAATASRVKSLEAGREYAAASAPTAAASCSRTASSTSFIPATSATCSRRARLGDVLIIGLNADASVRRNKGPQRPINDEQERAEILAALECVDCVVIFAEDTPAEIIKAIQPDILVKGADWAEDAIVGRDTVEARGGQVVRVPVEQGFSTTEIIRKVRALLYGRQLPTPTTNFQDWFLEVGRWKLTARFTIQGSGFTRDHPYGHLRTHFPHPSSSAEDRNRSGRDGCARVAGGRPHAGRQGDVCRRRGEPRSRAADRADRRATSSG